MEIVKKILLIIAIVILVFIAAIIILLFIASKQPAVKEDYFEKVKTDKPLEAKYTAKGNYEVAYIEFDAENDTYKKYEIWYPAEMEKGNRTYPLVVMANGSGVAASKYTPIFEHLASWGFIVIGNEDPSSWSGESSAKSLDYMLDLNKSKESIFYQKVDTANIGIAGHSQGGVGAVNAVTNQSNGNYYKTIYTASTTHLALAEGLKWSYDVSKIDIPYLMVAGTLKNDAGNGTDVAGIAPLWSLQENYDRMSNDVVKIFSRRVNADHGDMLACGDGYMTAWFMYYLYGDTEAGNAFFGENAEILTNANWQDTKKNH